MFPFALLKEQATTLKPVEKVNHLLRQMKVL